MIDPETTYRTFISHTQRYRQCRTAGGELADDSAFCPTGRALARQWGNAKIRQAAVEREAEHGAVFIEGAEPV
ncbi:MAG TPA: hypothetical protein VGZ23_00960 [bacterium]|nr:hypothetical protein [bacterium]